MVYRATQSFRYEQQFVVEIKLIANVSQSDLHLYILDLFTSASNKTRAHRITIPASRSSLIIQIISSYYHLDGFLLAQAELKQHWIKPSPQAVNMCDCNCWHALPSPSSAARGCNCVTVGSNRARALMTESRELAWQGPRTRELLRRKT